LRQGITPKQINGICKYDMWFLEQIAGLIAAENDIKTNGLPKDAKVLLLDDVLATGGTLVAADKLIRSAGFEVAGAITLLEITFLNGSALLNQHGIRHQSVLTS